MCLPSSLCKYVISVVLFCYVVCFVFYFFHVLFCFCDVLFLNLRQEILKNKCMIWWYIYQLHVKKKKQLMTNENIFWYCNETYYLYWFLTTEKKGENCWFVIRKKKTTHVLITWPFFSFVSCINKNGFSCLNWIIELNC